MSAPDTFERIVMSKCDVFTDFQLWPLRQTLDPQLWLSNFTPAERPYAVALLNGFIFYPKSFVIDLLCHSFQDLSCDVSLGSESFADAKHRWSNFRQNLLVCIVTGEEPNESDSGHVMVRYVRQNAGIDQSQILKSTALVPMLIGLRDRTIVFVDDFVGSGEQFITTWKRTYPTATGDISYESIAAMGLGHKFIYIPVVATSYGLGRIASDCIGAIVRPAHEIDSQYDWLSAACPFWPANLKQQAFQILENASSRAGIPTDRWRGFHDLGLGLAFDHSTPDANLPIFYWEENGWKPLLKRS